MNIREITKIELEELLDLYGSLHEHDEPLPPKEVVNQVWTNIQSNSGILCFGLYDQGSLVSSCTLVVIPNLTRGCRSYGVIENVVTHTNYRGLGYGKKVLDHALRHAWKNNCYKVVLTTSRLTEDIFKFYESVGFSRYEKQAFIAKPKST
ncbi:MAG: GNAT family N-acetyltransferase [Calditrichaeota bacterium]|nr:GNAT family N-acetyltransferase [Calditrichota bacterium]